MSIREMLAKGNIKAQNTDQEILKVQKNIETYWSEYEFIDNGFELKDTTKAHRMEKSDRARAYRKNIKKIKQKHLENGTQDTNWYNKRVH